MLLILSPAKSLDFETPAGTDKYTQPEYLPQSQQLVKKLKDHSPAKLASLMKISDKLASLNAARYGSWDTPFTQENAKQALLSFTGDVYRGLDANSLDAESLEYAQQHVRILSGLYGILKPLDLMQPYRLEMGTKLVTEHGKNLYEFWGSLLHDAIAGELSDQSEQVLVNLASKEYFTAVKLDALPYRVITPVFKDWKNGQYKFINFFAKYARGLMARYVIDNQITKVDDLKGFDYEDYHYSEEFSSEDEWVFIRKRED